MKIFAIESSCDETSVCIIKENKDILSHITYSQQEHAKFGGVIPELASRSHLQILQKITKKAFSEAKLNICDIDFFCSTCGPGLIGGLLVGSIFTKSLAIGSKKPFFPINHLEAHLLSSTFNNNIQYPHLSFLLTGGHTQIYLINSINDYILFRFFLIQNQHLYKILTGRKPKKIQIITILNLLLFSKKYRSN